mgnify:CR=1 FL=1
MHKPLPIKRILRYARNLLIFLGVLVGLVTTAIVVWAAWIGLNGDAASAPAAASATEVASETQAPSDVAPEASAPVAASAVAAPLELKDDESKVVVDNGVVKFYFASGKSDLAKGGNEALAEVVKGVKAGRKAVISGYHDSTGNLAQNQELAKKRAFSVRDALVALGVPAEQIELKKPEQSAGSGDNAEALVCDQIRENSRIYPRPVPSQMFLEAPFDFDVPTLECLLQPIGRKEENKDIKFTQTSSGTIFLYSDKYLDDDLAEFLAEEQEMRPLNP